MEDILQYPNEAISEDEENSDIDDEDPSTPEELLQGMATVLAFAPDGMWLVAGYNDGQVLVWPIGSSCPEDTESAWALERRAKGIVSIAYSSDGRLLATASADGVINVWDLIRGPAAGRLEHEIDSGHRDRIIQLVFSPCGAFPKLASTDGTEVCLWDTHDGRKVYGGEKEGFTSLYNSWLTRGIRSLAFNFDGTLLAAGSIDSIVPVWEANGGFQKICLMARHQSELGRQASERTRSLRLPSALHRYQPLVAFSPDMRYIASTVQDKVRIGRPYDPSPGLSNAVEMWTYAVANSIAFSHQGHYFVTGTSDGYIGVWSMADYTLKAKSADAHGTDILTLLVSKDDKYIFTSSRTSGKILVWNVGDVSRKLLALYCETKTQWDDNIHRV